MDSKLVVEQMSGRWKIKHPDMKPLALEANRLAPFGTTYTWMPREQNQHADRLANEALDGLRSGVTYYGAEPEERQGTVPGDEEPETAQEALKAAERLDQPSGVGFRGWSPDTDVRTTLVLVRHGVTPLTAEKRFSGGLASANPGLATRGATRCERPPTGSRRSTERVDALVSSPVRRTRESADILAERFGLSRRGGARLRRDGVRRLGRADLRRRSRRAHKADLDGWIASLDGVPGGDGESFRAVEKRVLARARPGARRARAGRRSWSSATSRRSRRWWRTPCARPSSRSSGWS